MTKIFIDGREGTTGLKIVERFENRDDIQLLTIDDAKRKDPSERKKLINSADVCFLCLPDQAARESVSLIENSSVKIIDTSTAHRTEPDWSYGFPELSDNHRSAIKNGKRISVPGCHASGFNSIVFPLTSNGVMPKDYPIVCFSVTGYSGAGKGTIAVYESQDRDPEFGSPRQYALTQNHKHLKEMKAISNLSTEPIFNPIISDYYSGMVVSVPIFTGMLTKKYSMAEIHAVLENHYKNSKMVKVMPLGIENEINMIGSNNLSGKDNMEIFVFGNDDRVVVASRFDNLGKGASGAAIQCLNIMLGLDETTGLNI